MRPYAISVRYLNAEADACLDAQGGENEKASGRWPPISFEAAQTGGYRYRQTPRRGAQKGGQQVLYYLLY